MYENFPDAFAFRYSSILMFSPCTVAVDFSTLNIVNADPSAFSAVILFSTLLPSGTDGAVVGSGSVSVLPSVGSFSAILLELNFCVLPFLGTKMTS